jgi:CheY-like chemotaxis protein
VTDVTAGCSRIVEHVGDHFLFPEGGTMSTHSGSMRILVVDDERTIADTLAVILRHAGYETEAVYSGEQAVARSQSFRPDVVIADYSMPPGMTGLEAVVKIKKSLPGTRVLMLSGQAIGPDYEPYRLKGYNFLLLSKPLHPEQLIKNVKDADTSATESVRPRILNVDDVEEHRYSISRLLARAGFEVSEAGTGAEALRQAIEEQPELVLLDIHLPDITGYDVCNKLKESPQTAQIAVVHITASDASPQAAAHSANVGADEFLTHPIVPSRLIHRIRELLQQRYLEQFKA